jgi:hypothetical protein
MEARIPWSIIDALHRLSLPLPGDHIGEGFAGRHTATARLLKPILTHLANAAGLPSSPYFDADGNSTFMLGPERKSAATGCAGWKLYLDLRGATQLS